MPVRSVLSAILIFLSSVDACESVSNEYVQEKFQQWQNNNSQSYSYVIQKQCFCAPEYTKKLRVTVVNSKVSEVVEVASGQNVIHEVFDQQLTISQWYEFSLKSIDSEHGEFDIKFDKDSILPSSIYIDQHKMRADDEYTVILSDLNIL